MSILKSYFKMNEKPIQKVTTEILKMRTDAKCNEESKVNTILGEIFVNTTNCIVTDECEVNIESIEAGKTFAWMFSNDELHWILSGKAKMTYSLAGTSHTKKVTVNIVPGDIYLLPLGSRVSWEVDQDSPLKRLSISLQ